MSRKNKRQRAKMRATEKVRRERIASEERASEVAHKIVGLPRSETAIGVVAPSSDNVWHEEKISENRGEWKVDHAATPDPRQVAVQFYLSMLSSCISEGVHLRAVGNRVGAPFPKCITQFSIVEEALRAFEKETTRPLRDSERNDFRQLLNTHLAGAFFRRLRNAHIFSFKSSDMIALYKLADVYTTSSVGAKWASQDDPQSATPEEIEKTVMFTLEEGVRVPFPEKLPFSSCYFAWGPGVRPTQSQCDQYGLRSDHFNLIMASLISEDGWAFTIALQGKKDSVGFAIGKDQTVIGGMQQLVIIERIGHPVHTHPEHELPANVDHFDPRLINPGWVLPYTLAPWILVYAVDAINANDSLVKVQSSTLKERLQYKALTKRSRQQFMPAPYYTVIIQPTTYEQKEREIKSRPRQWSHQWDVRGHYGHRIKQGTLPIDEKEVTDLHKRKYEIFHALHRMTSEVYTVLMKRHIAPPAENEWVAYLKFYKTAYVKGPADKPYIQAKYKLGRGLPNA